jgi:hypothetical protein
MAIPAAFPRRVLKPSAVDTARARVAITSAGLSLAGIVFERSDNTISPFVMRLGRQWLPLQNSVRRTTPRLRGRLPV